MMNEEMKAWIDNADYEQLLSKCRYAPAGDPFFAGEVGDYYLKVMAERRAAPGGNAAHVAASKAIGWDR
jgi:hypothetical protein